MSKIRFVGLGHHRSSRCGIQWGSSLLRYHCSEVPVPFGDPTQRKFSSELPKPLTGLVECKEREFRPRSFTWIGPS
jgi:hypothetical protein